MNNEDDVDDAPVTLADFVARAAAASGGEVALRRRLGVSRATMEHMCASQRVLSRAEVDRMTRALHLGVAEPPRG